MQLKFRLSIPFLAAALLVIPASASAGTKSQTATLAAVGSGVTVTAKCTDGQRATGGGFAGTPPSGSGGLYVHESRKVGQRKWRVSATEFNGSAPVTLTAFAYCAADGPKTTEESRTVPVVGPVFGPRTSADVSCGSGKARAGGFATSAAGSTAPILESFRLAKKTWRSTAYLSGGSATLTSYVYCADGSKPAERSGSTSSNVGAPVTATSAACKHGARPTAGGFREPVGDPSDTVIDLIYRFVRLGKAWQTTALLEGGPASATLTSIAYCA